MRDHNALPRQHPLPEQFHPPNTGKAPQYRPQIPISGGHNRTWMVIPYPEGHNVTKRGAAGKRYERGLTGEADHGVPGVLLPSQPRHTSQPTKPPYRHKTTLPRHFHPPDSERKHRSALPIPRKALLRALEIQLHHGLELIPIDPRSGLLPKRAMHK